MPPRLSDQVVVITGASSGIGRETAIRLGWHGAAVVLAARNRTALEAVAGEVERLGGQALVVVADVAEWDQVQRLADEAVARFGRIDTWVNNAGVIAYGPVEAMKVEEIERVVRVNLMGAVHGMKAVLPIMRGQGSGTIVNVASVEAERAVPLTAAYAASKHGLRGFSEALRLELEAEGSPVRVTLLQPASINTPLFEHALSTGGVRPLPMPPVYEPRVVAEAILFAAEHPRRSLVAGGSGKLLTLADRLSPRLMDQLLIRYAHGLLRSPPPDGKRGNLFEPRAGTGAVAGHFGRHSWSTSLYTRHVEQHPRRVRWLAGALALLGAAAFARRQTRR